MVLFLLFKNKANWVQSAVHMFRVRQWMEIIKLNKVKETIKSTRTTIQSGEIAFVRMKQYVSSFC